MSLLPVYFNSNGRSKTKRKKTIKSVEHEKWLLEKGLHPSQIKSKKVVDKGWKKNYIDSMMIDRNDYVSAGMSGNASSCAKRDIMTNLHKEPENVRKEILDKASRVMPLFNKGGLQYATPGTDLTQVGTKSRRG